MGLTLYCVDQGFCFAKAEFWPGHIAADFTETSVQPSSSSDTWCNANSTVLNYQWVDPQGRGRAQLVRATVPRRRLSLFLGCMHAGPVLASAGGSLDAE